MNEHPVQDLADALKAAHVAFFAGAGVSIESGLPSVADIIGRTGRRYLPTFWRHSEACGGSGRECTSTGSCHFAWLQDIQPEQFYGLLLQVSGGDTRCLDLWRVLHRDAQERGGYHPEPTLIHYLIVCSSAAAAVPIFTVNFDDMFERACSALGLAYRVFNPDDLPPDDNWRAVAICKLHGSVQGPDGEYVAGGIRTTMEAITQRGELWVQFLRRTMAATHLTFVGYSGRDIDYYPSILDSAVSGEALRPFWFGRFDSTSDPAATETLSRAQACGAALIPGYPSDLFGDPSSVLYYSRILACGSPAVASRLRKAEQDLHGQGWALASAKDAVLDRLTLTLPVADVPEELLWLRTLLETSHVIEADQVAARLRAANHQAYSSSHRLLFATDEVVVARERAVYNTYRHRARALASLAKTRGAESPSHLVFARREVTSSLQMEVPNHLPFALTTSLGDLFLLLRVLARFHLLDPLYYVGLLVRYPDEHQVLGSSADIAEARVRRLAIWVGVRERLLRSPPAGRSWTAALVKGISGAIKSLSMTELRRLQVQAQSNGNYRTLESVHKYHFRLTGDPESRMACERIAALVGDLSAVVILARDAGTTSSDSGRAREAELQRGIADSARSGNRMNEIKQVLALAEYRLHHVGEDPLHKPLVDDWERLEELIRAVSDDSDHLRRALGSCLTHLRAIRSE